MTKFYLPLSFLFGTLLLLSNPVQADDHSHLKFVENKNQWTEEVKFKTDLNGGHVYFSNNSFQYVYYSMADLERVHELKHEVGNAAYDAKIKCYAYNVHFVNANDRPNITSENKLPYYENYFIGNDPKKWAGNVGVYENIRYQNLYEGIDLKAYSISKSFKYDILVHPNADISPLKLRYEGVRPTLLANGNLKMDIGFNTMEETAPYCYQMIHGKKVEVKCNYVLSQNGDLSFAFPNGYNTSYELVIDPVLVFATYSSSTAMTFGFSATYDLSGSLYAGGECFGVGWNFTVGAFQTTYGGGVDAGINKYTPNGSGIVYATYYGGSGSDLPNNMVVNANNQLAMTGATTSSNLPVTIGCYDNTLGGQTDAYVAHFNSAGTALIGATYIGGSAIDGANSTQLSPNYGDGNRGEIYFDVNDDIVVAVSTTSADFPTTPGAYQSVLGGQQDGCFFKLNNTCSNLLFSTYIGGSGMDAAFSIAKTSIGNWVICGGTTSANFPTTPGSITPAPQGGTDAFVTVFNNAATGVVASTYIGTNTYDHAFKVQVDPNDTIYVCGQTNGVNFPVSPGVYSNPGSTIFIQKLDPNLNALILSTRIGQQSNLVPTAFLKDNCGNVYFAGFQAGPGLPLTANAFQVAQGGFWLSVLTGDFSMLVYATYMGAAGDHVDGGTSRFDPQGIVYHSVCTASANQYQSPGCYSPTNMAGSWDVASFKFNFELSGVTAGLNISPNDSGCAPYPVTFINNSQFGLNYMWYFGDGDSSNLVAPTHTYLAAGVYNVMLVAYNPNGCISSDTAYTQIKVIAGVDATFTTNVVLDCVDDTVHVSLIDTSQNALFAWNFGNGGLATGHTNTMFYNNQGIYTITCTASNGFCFDTMQTVVNLLHPIDAVFGINDSICLGQITVASSNSVPQGFIIHTWDFGDGTIVNNGTPIQPHTYTAPGYYTIKLLITDTLGCTDSAFQNVFVDQPAYVNFTASDSNVCVGQPIFFNDTVAPHTLWFEWNMDDGTNMLNVHDPQYSWQKGGTYNVKLIGHYLICPADSVVKPIIVNEYPSLSLGKDTAICPGITGSLLLTDLNNPTALYQWSTGETGNGITVTQPGRYWVKASNGDCSTVDSIWIKRDCYLNIPNAFSPDGDGLNDYFLPRELLSSGLKSFTMNIYNRWGENIFTTSSLDGRGWDGRYNGVPQLMGVYVYVIDAAFINDVKKTFKGNVTLVR
ncbi:MAG: PKD domain-containing protein [Bacteroidetes bacterium]|nr:PKD domain-containing protein [Bacteroidota bacterium]